jgi:TRAP-type C4-dicarboxylate transport system permease small subunit
MNNGGTGGRPAWRGPDRLVGLLSAIAGVLIFSIMAVTFVDVLGRYFFKTPIPGGFEIVEFIMGMMIFAALPVISYGNAHVTVDLFDRAFRGTVRKIKTTFVLLFSAVMTAFMGVRLWASAQHFFETRQLGIQLDILIAPFIFVMAIMSFLAAVLLLLLTWSYLKTGIEPTGSGNMG